MLGCAYAISWHAEQVFREVFPVGTPADIRSWSLVFMCLWLGLLVAALLVAALASLSRTERIVAVLPLELALLALISGSLSLTLFNDYTIFAMSSSTVTGLRVCSERDWKDVHVVQTALTLDVIISLVHLGLPIRWFLMLGVDVLLVVAFVVYTAFLPGEHMMRTVVTLSLLVAGASVGLWSYERSDRDKFSTIAAERSLRAQAEFGSVQAGGKAQASVGAASRSRTPSADNAYVIIIIIMIIIIMIIINISIIIVLLV